MVVVAVATGTAFAVEVIFEREDYGENKKKEDRIKRSSVLLRLIAKFRHGLIPMRFVSFHSIGFVHPHAKHVIFNVT